MDCYGPAIALWNSVSPLSNGSQLVVGNIDASSTPTERWMRARLYLTQDHRYFEFVFMTVRPDDPHEERYWYWINSSPKGPIANIYGPFPTTLRVPGPGFLAEAVWGNAYPLMCSDMNQQGIDCDHWFRRPVHRVVEAGNRFEGIPDSCSGF